MPPAPPSESSSYSDAVDIVPVKGKFSARITVSADPDGSMDENVNGPMEDDKSGDGDDEEDEEGEEEEEDEEGGAGDEYRVDKIMKHKTVKGHLTYLIKWLGYPNRNDYTWEPVENLANAQDLLDEYNRKAGIAPMSAKKDGSTKRAAGESPEVNQDNKRARTFNPTGYITSYPEGSWEDHVIQVTSILDNPENPDIESPSKNGKEERYLSAIIEWNNTSKSEHRVSLLRRKCPQALLDYYEDHLVFTTGSIVDHF